MENELMEMLAQALGMGGSSERVMLADTEEAKETDLYTEVRATMHGLMGVEKENEKLHEELEAKYDLSEISSEEELQELLTVDEYVKLRRLAESFGTGKQIVNHLLSAVAIDGSSVLIEVEDEDYDGCNCTYCSLKAQIESENEADDDE